MIVKFPVITNSINEDIYDDMYGDLYDNNINELSSLSNLEQYLSPDDVADLLKCSKEDVQIFMRRSDFPLIKIGDKQRVNRLALLKYSQIQRV